MQLQTSIKPRLDGTVIVAGLDGQDHVFAPNEVHELCCDVSHEATVAHLLGLGDGELFWPVNPDDFDEASRMQAGGGQDGEAGGGSGDSDPDDDPEDDPEDTPNPNALPVEANTPPSAPKAKTGGKGGKK